MSTLLGAPPYLFAQAGQFPGPFEYDVPASLEVQTTAATATFDGTSAATAFLACLSFYSPQGNLLSRVFPTSPVPAGGTAQVSYAPFPGGMTSGLTLPTALISIYKGNNVAIGAGGTAFLPWNTLSFGPAQLDLTVPTQPTALATGLYWLSAIVFSTAPLSAGTYAELQLVGQIFPISTSAESILATPPGAIGTIRQSFSILWSAKAGAFANVKVVNHDTVGRTFHIFQVSVEKVL